MKEKKKEFNLKSSVLLLLLLVTFLIIASYAWFTSNQVVTVSELEVNVVAQNGLQISVDGTNWKSVIQKTDLTNTLEPGTTYPAANGNTNQLPASLQPVSTAGNITGGFMDMFFGVVGADEDPMSGTYGEYFLSSSQETEARGTGGNFIAFDLFFKVDEDTQVYLSKDGSSVVHKDTASKGMENAARIAFLNEGNRPAGTPTQQIQQLRDAMASTDRTIWEPNYNIHTPAAIAHALDTYGVTITATSTRIPYDGIKNVFSGTGPTGVLVGEADSDKHPTLFETVTIDKQTTQGFAQNVELFELEAGITKMRIYMWIEGQDFDCENNASGSKIGFNLQITTRQS